MKPISNSDMDRNGFIAIADRMVVRGEKTNVIIEKGKPYVLLHVYLDEYAVSRRARIMNPDGWEIEIEYAWLEPY